jgi:hypothetical protein
LEGVVFCLLTFGVKVERTTFALHQSHCWNRLSAQPMAIV